MQASYHITTAGVMHAIASCEEDTNRSLLLYILKQHATNSVLFSDILEFLDKDTKLAFTQIYEMINLQLIDIDEENKTDNITANNINDLFTNNSFILSDLNGLPVTRFGFSNELSINISAIACDYFKISRRGRQHNKIHKTLSPLSIETSWQNQNIIIYLLYFGEFTLLLTTKNPDTINQPDFIQLASFLCNRYNYE